MTTQSPEYYGPIPEVERINEAAADKARKMAEQMFENTIETVYAGIQVYLKIDQEAAQQIEDDKEQSMPAYVLEDLLTAPRKDGSFVSTLSYQLIPEPSETSGNNSMVIHIPTGDKSLFELTSPDELPVPDEVYIEHNVDHEQHWYAISKRGMYEYIPLAQQDEDNNTVLSDSGIWQWMSDRVPETMEKASSILRDIINWRTVPQRQINL